MKFSSFLIVLGLIASIYTKKNVTKKEKKNGSKKTGKNQKKWQII